MLPNAFIGKPKKPTEDELAAALGTTKPLWDQLIAELAKERYLDVQDWNSYSPKAGWAAREGSWNTRERTKNAATRGTGWTLKAD
jgi:Protein of unknown function (DUF3788)